jgi:DNA replication and repair protein RecF
VAEAAVRREFVDDGAPERERARDLAHFTRLALTDFRSYASAEIALDGRPAVFAGPNGAGKTNILEAISLIGPGRGLRGAKLEELARIEGAGGWAVSARLYADGDERKLGVGAAADSPERRQCRIDERAASGPSAFSDCVRFMWLTPAQDRLFVESPGERRRFLDRMSLAHDAAHGRAGGDYELAMRQRQKLLDEGSRDDAWLSSLEAEMAAAGVALAASRRETASALAAAEVSGEFVDDGAFPAADLALEGLLETLLDSAPAVEVEEEFAARLKSNRRFDTEAGRALVGPHRSDFLVTHREKQRPARLCSTGEQKALLIGLVLANARALALSARFRGDAAAPLVLLLDEIAAHLDERRRASLFDILDALGFQVFMTGTDKSLFSHWGKRAQVFSVEGGAIKETSNGN